MRECGNAGMRGRGDAGMRGCGGCAAGDWRGASLLRLNIRELIIVAEGFMSIPPRRENTPMNRPIMNYVAALAIPVAVVLIGAKLTSGATNSQVGTVTAP